MSFPVRIGWSPKRDELAPAGRHVIKRVAVPAGSWMLDVPIRIRWGNPNGPVEPNMGINVEWGCPWLEDPDVVPPVRFEVADHENVEAGEPGDADSVYPIKCWIVTTKPTEVEIVVVTKGRNVCTVVDGDGFRVPV